MKLLKIGSIILLSLFVMSCKQETQVQEKDETVTEVTQKEYPTLISKMLETHGSLATWNNMQQLSFNNDGEVTTTALHSRKSRIDSENSTIGFDGKNVWVLEKNDTKYEGNAKFYYNLMFYFQAMPFVLADDGITYSEIPNLNFEGKSYPGLLISYSDGVGSSSKDQYKVYTNPETGQMEWLGYTVTFFSDEVGKEFNFIKYENWESINGLKLPTKLTWYNTEDNKPTAVKNSVEFTDIKLEEKVDEQLYEMPENAVFAE